MQERDSSPLSSDLGGRQELQAHFNEDNNCFLYQLPPVDHHQAISQPQSPTPGGEYPLDDTETDQVVSGAGDMGSDDNVNQQACTPLTKFPPRQHTSP